MLNFRDKPKKMIAHESGCHCGEYFRYKDVGEEHYILQKNYDEFEDEWTEPRFLKYNFLLYVNETAQSEEIDNIFKNEKKSCL